MRVHVENFQSLAKVDLDVEGLTVIVGPSDRGKSALLRAVEAALFNRPGDQFVRQGAKSATVSLQLNGHSVHWVKGGGLNKFQVDGTDYSRVGTKAPKTLQDIGFRDTLIGARLKDDGKWEGGEVLRPQVARQFDRIFLLNESGPFLNEALVQLSRLGVLQRANRFCSGDLRSQKALLKVRQEDLVVAEAGQASLEPIVAIRTRVHALEDRVRAIRAQQDRAAKLRQLLARRRQMALGAAQTLPPPRTAPLPDVDRLVTLRTLVARRAALKPLQKVKLPKARQIKKAVVTAMNKWRALQPLTIERRQRVNWVDQYSSEAKRRQRESTKWLEEFEEMKATVKVCPTCDRAF